MASPHTPQRVWSSLRDLVYQITKGNLAADGPFVIDIELQVEAEVRSWLGKNYYVIRSTYFRLWPIMSAYECDLRGRFLLRCGIYLIRLFPRLGTSRYIKYERGRLAISFNQVNQKALGPFGLQTL